MTSEQQKNDYEIINIKVENKQRIISDYSYDGTDKLNKELSEFIVDKTKNLNTKKKFKLNFYSPSHIDQKEVKETIKNHFYDDYLDLKQDLKRNSIFLIIMAILGVITLGVLLACYHFFSNFYYVTILEITAWLFLWEALGGFILTRPNLRKKCNQMKSIYTAKVEVINYNDKEREDAKE